MEKMAWIKEERECYMRGEKVLYEHSYRGSREMHYAFEGEN